MISGGSVISAAIIGAVLNRKMTRIELKVNGRIDQLLAEVSEANHPKPAKEEP